jgi:hypothetical protein
MPALSTRNVVLLYAIESMLFTTWPYSMAESVYTVTNLIAPASLVGIACLLCSYARLAMYGTDGTAQRMWQHTTTFRKFAALLYYSSVLFVISMACCTVFVTFLRRRLRRTNQQGPMYVLDCVFVAYIVIVALMKKSVVLVLFYVVYFFFLRMHAEIQYMVTHFYFLALFPMLARIG